jgi:hypothetical protein
MDMLKARLARRVGVVRVLGSFGKVGPRVGQDAFRGACGQTVISASEAELDGDAEVGVGRQHDAGMAELVGDRLEFLARQQHQRGGTVTEIVQPYGRQAGLLDEVVELVGQVGRGTAARRPRG